MSLYAIGDFHLSFTVNKPMDVFDKRWKNHVVKIEKYWKRKVTENDTVVLDSAVVRETNTPLYSNWNVVPRKVRILEKGEVIKYLDFTPNSYYLDWKDIQAIKRAPRATTDLTGLIDVVALRTGEKYEGQIIEQIPGERIRF